jgi:HAD superfamily hydrolase (TIGR01450 family)
VDGPVSALIVCDLDGVVFLGETGVPGAGEALLAIEGAGHEWLFCTNNSWRTPGEVAAKIRATTGYPAEAAQVLSSAMAAAELVSQPPVLVVGGNGIRAALEAKGIEVCDEATAARTVVVGLDPGFDYARLAAAAGAVRHGARLIATNLDSTYPTEAGLLPGAGALVAAVERASGVEAVPAGKPYPPIRQMIASRAGARPVWVVGDREDTDLSMAYAEGWDSVLVLTGVSRTPQGRPSLVLESIALLPAHLG